MEYLLSSRTLRIAASATSTFALIAAGIAATSSAATAEPNPIGALCPDVFPADDLTGGDRVTGLTTAGSYVDESDNYGNSSETPEQFTGTFLGTIQDDSGDLLAFKLKGSRITKANGDIDAGVWSGMSGSPVYAEDGRLIGAVSYTFGDDGSSEYAGVTPAADMYDLLDAPTPQRQAAAPKTIQLSSSEKAVMVKKGVATANASQLRRLDPVPSIGVGNKAVKSSAIAKIARRAGVPVPRAINSGGSTQTRDIPIVPGGNLAVASAYGSLPSYGVGTATAICGDQVLAFGHPMNWAPSSMTMHGASTVAVQAAGAYSFKLTNLGAPNGILVKDGLNAILGKFGTIATYPKVTSTTNGQESVTTVPNPEALPMVTAMQAYRDGALALDRDAGGTATVSWKIDYTRANGAAQSLSRSGKFSSRYSISEDLMMSVAGDVELIQSNEFEDVKVTGVTFNTTVEKPYKALKINRIDVLRKAGWTPKKKSGTKITARAGKTLKLVVYLDKADRYSTATPTKKFVTWKIPSSARGSATYSITGNGGSDDEYYDDCEEFDMCEDEGFYEESDAAEPTSFNQLIKLVQSLPRQDTFTTSVRLMDGRSATSTFRATTKVSGRFDLKLNIKK